MITPKHKDIAASYPVIVDWLMTSVNEKRVSQARLGELVGVSQASVSQMIKNFSQDGHLSNIKAESAINMFRAYEVLSKEARHRHYLSNTTPADRGSQ